MARLRPRSETTKSGGLQGCPLGRLFFGDVVSPVMRELDLLVQKTQHYYCSLYRGMASFANSTFHPRLLRRGFGPGNHQKWRTARVPVGATFFWNHSLRGGTKSQHYYCSLYRGTASFANYTFHPRLLRRGFGPRFRTSDHGFCSDFGLGLGLLWRTSALSFGPRFRAPDRTSGFPDLIKRDFGNHQKWTTASLPVGATFFRT